MADALGKTFDELYANDAIHRLKDLERGTLNANKDAITDKSFAECWSLDSTGNWKKYLEDTDGDDTWNLDQSRSANRVNEITDITETSGSSWVTPAYSKAGNMTTVPQPADPTKSYSATYDAWNRLVKTVDDDTSSTVSEYEYDGAKRRTIHKSYSGASLDETEHLYYTEPSKWQIIEERLDGKTNPNQQYVWGLRYIDEIISRDKDTTGNGVLDQRHYATQDGNWNVTSIIDIQGNVDERYACTAYGVTQFLDSTFHSVSSSTYDWDILFAGYRRDVSIQTFHVRNRVYSAELGRWLQRDPLSYSNALNSYPTPNDSTLRGLMTRLPALSVPSQPLFDTHLYRYAQNAPLNYVDPSGLLAVGFRLCFTHTCNNVSHTFCVSCTSFLSEAIMKEIVRTAAQATTAACCRAIVRTCRRPIKLALKACVLGVLNGTNLIMPLNALALDKCVAWPARRG